MISKLDVINRLLWKISFTTIKIMFKSMCQFLTTNYIDWQTFSENMTVNSAQILQLEMQQAPKRICEQIRVNKVALLLSEKIPFLGEVANDILIIHFNSLKPNYTQLLSMGPFSSCIASFWLVLTTQIISLALCFFKKVVTVLCFGK